MVYEELVGSSNVDNYGSLDEDEIDNAFNVTPKAYQSTPTFRKFAEEFKYARSDLMRGEMTEKGCNARVGQCLHIFADYVSYIRLVYLTILGNMLIICSIIIYMKLTGWEPYLYWDVLFLPLSNWYFQFANIFLICSYAMQDYLMLRICLCAGCACFASFGLFSPAGVMPDTVMYNSCMVLINAYFIVQTLWQKRHIDFRPDWELVYGNHFESIGWSRHDFEKLQSIGLSRTEKPGVVMHHVGDLVTSLCIIVDGEILLKDVHDNQVSFFVENDITEANEWITGNLNPSYQRYVYNYVATKQVRYVKWTRESLVKLLEQSPELCSGLRAVLGLATARSWCRLGGARHDMIQSANSERNVHHNMSVGYQ